MRAHSAVVRVCVVLGTAAAAAILIGRSAATLAAAAVPSTAATVVDSQSQPVYSGGSTTPFYLSLPGQVSGEGSSSGVFCSNYSESEPQDLYSYLVPEGTDPSTVTFAEGPSTGGGLFDGGMYYGSETLTNKGQLPTLPGPFEWEPNVSGGFLTLNDLLTEGTTPGIWEAGLACANTQGTDQGDVTTLWNFQVTFAASSSDPNGFTWSVPVPPPPTTTTTTAPPSGGSGASGNSGSDSGSGASSSGSAPASGAASAPTPTAAPAPSLISPQSDLDGAAEGASSGGQGTTPVNATPSGTATGGSGSSGTGSNAPVKDPGILHDALTAAGLSSTRGIALDLLGVGLLLVVIGLVRRRKGDGIEELPA